MNGSLSDEDLNISHLSKTELSKNEEATWESADKEDLETIKQWVDKNKSYRTLEYFEHWVGPIEGDILELGAGHCWLSGHLSQMDKVDRVCAVELSENWLRSVAPPVLEYVNADIDVIDFYVGDFLNLEGFGANEFDIVVFDSAFHHTYHPIELLHEVSRVVKDDGYVLLQREPTLYPLLSPNRLLGPWSITLDNNIPREERQAETPEQNELIYSVKEYELFAHMAGLELEIYPQLHDSASLRSFRRPLVEYLGKQSQEIKKLVGLRMHTRWFIVLQSKDLPLDDRV
ncbi:class I SAM-dependent methyltransferase [Haloarcula sp. CBA1127]|uniref:class I SAM-dependent methyltransferase n=1 Tax=Haloarcula sp. CBA1127 TaxID=1765055 RepID=UPI00073F5972|nr:class I SAM-dependent methyltransferase [Haloarcula sp. CBA1127]